jgi:hypothetical protein
MGLKRRQKNYRWVRYYPDTRMYLADVWSQTPHLSEAKLFQHKAVAARDHSGKAQVRRVAITIREDLE